MIELIILTLITVGLAAIPVAILGLVLFLTLQLVRAANAQEKQRRAAWSAVGQELGLEPQSELRTLNLAGEIDGFRVNVYEVVVRNDQNHSTYTDIAVHGLPDRFALKGAGLFGDLFGSRTSLSTGDTAFDKHVRASGNPTQLLACLRHEVRQPKHRVLFENGGKVEKGTLYRSIHGHINSRKQLTKHILYVLKIASTMRPTAPTPAAQLLLNHQAEPNGRVRGALLERILQPAQAEQLPKDDIRKAAERGAQSDEPYERLVAAIYLGDLPVLHAIASTDIKDTSVRIKALKALKKTGADSLSAAIEACLRSQTRRTRRETLEWIAAARVYEALPAVGSLLDDPIQLNTWGQARGSTWKKTRKLALTITQTLKTLEHPDTEPLLVRLVQAPDMDIRQVAIHALGDIGTVSTIEVLYPFAQQGLAQAKAQHAIRRIQGRMGPAEAGAVSLAALPDAAGGLSLPTETIDGAPQPQDPTARTKDAHALES